MNAKYYGWLYLRNVWGVIANGAWIGSELSYVGPLFWLGALALWPLTLTFGAGIKTLIDGYNRKYTLDKEVLEPIPASINHMSEAQITQLCQQANTQEKERAYFSQSNSSASLMKKLLAYKEQANKEMNTERNEQITEKKIELALEQLHPGESKEALSNRRTLYLEERLYNYKLDEQHETELNNFKVQHSELACSKCLKADISSYMSDEKNNGKKLFQLLVAFFSPKQAEQEGNTESDRLIVNQSI